MNRAGWGYLLDYGQFYNWFYSFRKAEDRSKNNVVIVAVDDEAEKEMDASKHFGWPWPREFWGKMIGFLADSGARCVVIDIDSAAQANTRITPAMTTSSPKRSTARKFRLPLQR